MSTRPILRMSAAVALLGLVSACSLGGGGESGSGDSGKKGSGPTYRQAMDAMYPDALAATKAAVPGIEVEELPGGNTECGGADVLDGKDASKLRASAAIRIPLETSDTRTSRELVNAVADQLAKRQWRKDPSERTTPPGHEDGALLQMKKSGVRGLIEITAFPTPEESGEKGETWQTLLTNVITDCLRNPEWKG
ncbi:hypothetical protein [Streptomyces sp. SCSIO ZS0520]|uniref:hypothetical protein n=1 Tax=Streptomyces sp. SCSIO ZS0520 TaxID=2892996 RepID=UPI0021DB4E2A|nr:hypothetical protein [Streptomyces sp. SCSIO ZS0520]